MKPRRRSWTFGPDNPTARARTIARGCWHALLRADPTTAEAIRKQAAEYGEDVWLTPTPATVAEGAAMTRAEVAHLAGVDTPAVVMWGKRGIRRAGRTHHLRPNDGGEKYDQADVHEFLRLRDTPDTRAPRERRNPPCTATRSTSLQPTSTGSARRAASGNTSRLTA